MAEEQLSKAVEASISWVKAGCWMTQDQVVEIVQIGPEAVSRMECGIVTPSLVRLVQFAELFKCSIETFFNKTIKLTDDNINAIAQLLEKLNREKKPMNF